MLRFYQLTREIGQPFISEKAQDSDVALESNFLFLLVDCNGAGDARK